MRMKWLVAGLLTILMFMSLRAVSASELEYQINSVRILVYRDGLAHVIQEMTVNETLPSIQIELLASQIENVIALDENRTVLSHDIDGLNVTVYSLGAKSVFLEYDTASLTKKEAGVWTLVFRNPYNLTVSLPEESTIMYLNQLPSAIDTEDGKLVLSLFPGDWEISYVLPILPPAVFRVSGLTVSPTEIEVGKNVKVSVMVTNTGEGAGSYAVVLKINQVAEETKTVTLEPGKSTTVEFSVTKRQVGTYSVEISGQSGEFRVKEPSFPIPIEYLAVTITLAVVGVGLFFAKKRKPKADKIIKDHLDLRDEDKEVIQFIAEKGGRVFESEIRERFPDMPRTTLWRLVRRLEKMDIVTVRRIGLQNLIELRK